MTHDIPAFTLGIASIGPIAGLLVAIILCNKPHKLGGTPGIPRLHRHGYTRRGVRSAAKYNPQIIQ